MSEVDNLLAKQGRIRDKLLRALKTYRVRQLRLKLALDALAGADDALVKADREYQATTRRLNKARAAEASAARRAARGKYPAEPPAPLPTPPDDNGNPSGGVDAPPW